MEDTTAAEAKLELLRTVNLMLVGPPPVPFNPPPKTDRDGLQIHYLRQVEDLLDDVGDDPEPWIYNAKTYKLYNDGALYSPQQLQQLKFRFGDFFVTDLIPDGVVKGLTCRILDGDKNANEQEMELDVSFDHRIDLGLADCLADCDEDDEMRVVLKLQRTESWCQKYGGGDRDAIFKFKAREIANLAGISLETLLQRSREEDYHYREYLSVPECSHLQIRTLEEKLGCELVFETWMIVIPQSGLLYKWHKR